MKQFVECYQCGKTTEIKRDDNVRIIAVCNGCTLPEFVSNQPERSKREDSFLVLSNALDENGSRDYIKFSDFSSMKNFLDHLKRNKCTDYDITKLEKRCGALSTVETS